ncbi:MAG TPA: HEPN domain-containing protein [Spirochaetes bacterium]|nr:HEPN domain-containing protein [Spirochaetota bacterium]
MDDITVKEHINYWLSTADDDLTAARHLFEKGDYPHCLFFGHLVLEKALKALYVRNIREIPPFKHSLPYLAEAAQLTLDADQEKFFEQANEFNQQGRYPDIKNKFRKKCTREFTENNLRKIEVLYQWIINIIKS